MPSSLSQPRKIGGVLVGPIGYGAMNLTWKPQQTPDEQAFEAFKTAIDAVPKEAKAFINSGEFYGTPTRELNLQLLSRFFEKYPEYADRVLLSVKAGITKEMKPDSSLEALRENCENIKKHLGPHKQMDLFEPARVDTELGIEQTMKNLLTLQSEGHFKYIGLSETAAPTLRKAATIGKVDAVEIEYSPWATEGIEGPEGVMQACQELGIAMIAYSPLGRGFLTGQLRSRSDIPEGDMRLHLDRFSEENFPKNLKSVEELEKIAKKKACSTTQLALAWNLKQGEYIIPIPGSTRPEGVKESLESVNVDLSDEDLKAIRETIDSIQIVGGRYNAHLDSATMK